MDESLDSSNEETALAPHGAISNDSHENAFQSGLDNSEESDYGDEIYASDESANMSWVSWFCSLKGHEYFCEVPEDYIEDEFNLTGLAQTVNYYLEALDTIMDIEDDNEDPLDNDEMEAIDSSAEILYGLIHARYIITRNGLHQMANKYEIGEFGECPRYGCDGTFVIPCGRTDVPERDSVKLFCPSCLDIYSPPSSRHQKIDGAYFGTSFPHMFFQAFPSLIPTGSGLVYTPRIYGFAINEQSKAGPRMQWLRMRPKAETGNDEDDTNDKGNTTDSLSFEEAQDAGGPTENQGSHAASDEIGGSGTSVAGANGSAGAPDTPNKGDTNNESMDIGADRAGASRASTPAAAASERSADMDNGNSNADDVMVTASNSPRNSSADSPLGNRRKANESAASPDANVNSITAATNTAAAA